VSGGDPRSARDGVIPGAGVLGMWIFLATLAVLFLAAIVGYLVVRLNAPDWPPKGMPRLPGGLWLATCLLVAASVTVHRALSSIRSGDPARCTRWLAATLALGSGFLAVQGWNWWGLIRLHLMAASNLYAFTFFMLTGLHAAHVIGGIALLAVVLMRSRAGRYGSGRHDAVIYAAMYWHFLGAVWIVLFAVLVVFA
jgi:heme/copper-type cytochrome/quinol oxidase subunit 3